MPCGTCKRQLRRQLVALHGSMRTKFCSDMDPDCRAFGDGICVSRCCSRLRPWRRWLPCRAGQRQLRRKLVCLHGGVRTRACSDMDADGCALGHGVCLSYCGSELCAW